VRLLVHREAGATPRSIGGSSTRVYRLLREIYRKGDLMKDGITGPEADRIVAEVLDDIVRLHEMALRNEDTTDDGNSLRRQMMKKWQSLDEEHRLRIREGQQRLMKRGFHVSWTDDSGGYQC
jgi:hypothetical protein